MASIPLCSMKEIEWLLGMRESVSGENACLNEFEECGRNFSQEKTTDMNTLLSLSLCPFLRCE